MQRLSSRIPEGGAIHDSSEMTMEQYSAIMKKTLGHEYRRFIEDLMRQTPPPHGAAVLEIGPGPGWVGIWLAKERPDIRLDGLEASPDMRRVAQMNAEEEGVAERVRYLPGVVEQMEHISDASYDLVISRDSLHHWNDPVAGFREIARVVKPDGQVYLRDSRRDLGFGAKLFVNMIGWLFVGKMAKHWKSSIAASYTPSELQTMLNSLSNVQWKISSSFLDLGIQSA